MKHDRFAARHADQQHEINLHEIGERASWWLGTEWVASHEPHLFMTLIGLPPGGGIR